MFVYYSVSFFLEGGTPVFRYLSSPFSRDKKTISWTQPIFHAKTAESSFMFYVHFRFLCRLRAANAIMYFLMSN